MAAPASSSSSTLPSLDARDPTPCQQTAELASDRLPGAQSAVGPELTVYSDGSFASGYGGAGVAYKLGGVWKGRSVALGPGFAHSGVVELRAIEAALEVAWKAWEIKQEEVVTIVTDCACALEALKPGRQDTGAYETAAAVVRQWREDFAAAGVHVKFRWIPGHAGFEGNELADRLAKSRLREPAGAPRDFEDVYAEVSGTTPLGKVKDDAVDERVWTAEMLQQARADLRQRLQDEEAAMQAQKAQEQIEATMLEEMGFSSFRGR